MASQIAASVGRALRRVVSITPHDDVHFHVDSEGRPFACDYRRCDSPGLTLDEAAGIRS